ncbi:hypothetical protein F5B19DRAFT_485614 [Rostrohypoxylon terebratum]|nr:hypothetical protein F5B19DRAFT_485614 [Rostrohypoxylon terebratum]
MASIGQVTAAATNFRAENTNALVNVNLELNLFTRRFIKPPREYAEVGQHLAPSRLREAEGGTRHTIARKLGILFKDSKSLPSTLELIKAYGLRASEISRDSVANPRGNVSHGPFAGMIGADATTLWAAATSDLRDWDASVRAWMRVADSVMIKQQTQARLIVDNVSLSVNEKPDTYESVMNAWCSSMAQMEKLLDGVPLQVDSGDVLLALLAWHLYPDMIYLSKENQHIEQNDPLLKGRGVLTLGLEPSPRTTRECKSVYWTLPLSHLRYYGRLPVTRTQSIRTSDQDRITIDEFLWAKISAYIIDWDNGSVATEDILELVSDVMMRLHKGYLARRPVLPISMAYTDTWMMMVHRICLQYKNRLGEARVRKLKAMGQSLSTYLQVGRNLEDKIWFIREAASSLPTVVGNNLKYEYLIVCKHSFAHRSNGIDFKVEGFEYATAHPVVFDLLRGTWKHQRWLFFMDSAPAESGHSQMVAARVEEIKNMGEEVTVLDSSSLGRCSRMTDMHSQIHRYIASYSIEKASVRYSIVEGNIGTTALLRFLPHETIHQRDRSQSLGSELTTSNRELTWKTMQLMRSDAFIELLFRSMPDATVDVRAVQLDLSTALWCKPKIPSFNLDLPRMFGIQPFGADAASSNSGIENIDTATCFACIAMMETGSYNLSPDELQGVFAIGVADSLYIASTLVQDPSSKPISPIKRFTGNIGKSGMAFMVPPEAPEIKSYNTIDQWYQYEHKEFDGTMEDCFEGTSLHLSFSEASQAINVGFSGGQDVEAYFLETLVSVHERGTWIAELDILKAFKSCPDILRRRLKGDLVTACACDTASARGPRIISIDNFAEMLMPPMKAGIVRARGNWQARLAAVSICLAKGYIVVLKPEEMCWSCFSKANFRGHTVESSIQSSEVVMMII